jgi:DNA modification methylase
MDPYFDDGQAAQLYLGDCREVLATLPDVSVDAIITDPPYELGFMGKSWDSTGIAYDVEVWRQCWRVLKPGGHLAAFGGTRTYHRMACAIEDAGFEIRDSLHWIYGSGFPKGQDIAKSIDRKRGDHDQVLQVTAWLRAARDTAGWTTKRIDDVFGTNGMASHWTAIANKAASVPTMDQWNRLRDLMRFDDTDILPLVAELNERKGTPGEAWERREVVGHRHSGLAEGGNSMFLRGTTQYEDGMVPVTAPASDLAQRWQGWNTALRPAHEPILLARRSTGFNTTVANVLEHGTGALNVDACRMGATSAERSGRWPTNVLFGHGMDCTDGGDCQSDCPIPELGGEARFFPVFRYAAKASRSERPRLADGTAHTTVKPLSLIRWLIRLVTPADGLVLDPFAGSGTTLEAATTEGFRSVGVELESDHAALCIARLSKPIDVAIF